MTYSVKEIFYTLQGEGAQSGRPAVFCRFTGCNLWSGREQDRDSAECQFCDTDFVGTDGKGGGKFKTAQLLAASIKSHWPAQANARSRPYVVCTGGEPALQLDIELIDALHQQGFEIAIETNGTLALAPGIDWICVSPKEGNQIIVNEGDELKLVYPQSGNKPQDFDALKFNYFFLQPLDCEETNHNTQLCIEFCHQHPQWRLSLQTHKLIGIP